MQALAGDVKHIGDRVDTLEGSHEDLITRLDSQQTAITHNATQIHDLSMALYDQENHMHGNNIRVRCIPESREAPDMTTLVRSIFNQILNCPKDNPIEIDRAHRALWPKNKDPTHHRDIICC